MHGSEIMDAESDPTVLGPEIFTCVEKEISTGVPKKATRSAAILKIFLDRKDF